MRGTNKLTWFLGALVVLLTISLALQTTYLVWLHRELYLALSGKGPMAADLEKMLTAELDGLTGDGAASKGPAGDSLGLQREVERLMDDPSKSALIRDLLRDLGMEVEPPRAVAGAFNPTFDFAETPTRYVVSVALPDFKKSDIDASVEKGVLKVSGEERGREFRESFAFPGPVVAGTENIAFGDGKLIVSVLKEKAPPNPEGFSS
ncbi:MAG: Hsp20/alpha crystallin family protein [FCB group bacterium]|jgi:HSP20 family molecular chaperone IbpA|nr:Hsp20/alpha crystallin family protein [FCB group bacterium]